MTARWPFRLGTTSFIHPAGWADNVRALGADGRLRDVELLLFEDGPGQLPTVAELATLDRLRREHGDLSYTVHTPLAVSLASDDERRRRADVERVARVIALAEPLQPFAFVVHVYWGDGEHGPRPHDREAWRARAAASLRALVDRTGVAPHRLCVETLDYDPALIAPVVEATGVSWALDVGHAQRDGRDDRAFVHAALPATRVIQWHGVRPGDRDHRSLLWVDPARVRWLLETLVRARYHGVLTIEVFGADDLATSLAVIEGCPLDQAW